MKHFIKHLKKEKLFIWHKTLNIELSEQRIPQFIWAIKLCSYKTHGFHTILHFHEIFAFRIFARKKNFTKFRFVFASFISAKFQEQFFKMRPKILAFFLHCFAKRFVRWIPYTFTRLYKFTELQYSMIVNNSLNF